MIVNISYYIILKKILNLLKRKKNCIVCAGLTLGLHSKWVPGTDNEVINIVIQRSINTVPVIANRRRIMINLRGRG